MQGVKFNAEYKMKALQEWLNDGVPIEDVCDKFKCKERTLWRWKSIFDGTIESLKPKSCRPITPHPNAHTDEEVENIKKILKENPYISHFELYERLKNEYNYKRHIGGLYNYLRRNRMIPEPKLKNNYATMFDDKAVKRLNAKFIYNHKKELPLYFVELDNLGIFIAKEDNNNPCKLTVYYSLALSFKNKKEAEEFLIGINNTSKFILNVKEIKGEIK